jgi:hypothetical protein
MQTLQATANVVRIFFLRSVRGGSLLDRLLSRGISDYQKAFGFQSNIAHVILQVGNICYETTLEGTVTYEFTEEIFSLPRLICYWELNLGFVEFSEEQRKILDFILSRFLGKTLDVIGSLVYLAEHKSSSLIGFDTEEEDFSLFPKAHIRDNKLRFSLPFTCCTLANEVLYRCLNLPVASDSHLPASLLLTTVGLASAGIGDFFYNGLPPIVELT